MASRRRSFYTGIKRLFDIAGATFFLVVSSPLLAVVALLIKLQSPGPVLYRGIRAGRAGRPFNLLKFRSMVVDAERIGASSTAEDDPRITKVGGPIRRLKLDELPQLFNVLKGDMSFVGPRPQVQWAVELYTPEERAALDVRPGLLDYAFIRLPLEADVLSGSSDPDGDYMKKIHPHKMRLTLEYLSARSFWFDLKILLDTAFILVFARPVFFQRLSETQLEIL